VAVEYSIAATNKRLARRLPTISQGPFSSSLDIPISSEDFTDSLNRERQVDTASGNTKKKVKSISYVDDYISEILQLHLALSTGGARETPTNSILVDSICISGNMNAVVPVALI
jgi:hypothetical protein